jgi:NCS1 nucleoside transporter family
MSSGQVSGAVPEVEAELRGGEYGTSITEIEPGGIGFIPLNERRGNPISLFWIWSSPNFEFATVFVGVLAIAGFNQSFTAAAAAIILGTGLGSITHGILSSRGPSLGVPQMILSRIGFGKWGNILPAGLNAATAGIGWFAVNSVSGAFALSALFHWNKTVCVIIIVLAQILIAFFGYNMLEFFEKYAFPVLIVVFVVACIIIFTKAHPGSAPHDPKGLNATAGFLLTVGATFGYAAGWNPYAADYTRYFKPDANRKSTALWAGLGVFISCVLLELAGAAAVTIPGIDPGSWFGDNPATIFTGHLPSLLGKLTLLAIALGAIAANVINIYSGSISFLALGFNLPLNLRRAIVALGFGAIGFVLALYGLNHVSTYENFLLVIAYWIGPWLGVYFTDWYLRRKHHVSGFLFDGRHNPIAGWVSMLVAGAVSIALFSNQVQYTGYFPKHFSSLGDIAFEVGFVLAVVLYVILFQFQKGRQDEDLKIPTVV